MSFDLLARPTALELQIFQGRQLPGIEPVKAMKVMAASIGVPFSTYEGYYYGKRSGRMPAPLWTLLRITWDALAFAEWQRERRPSHEKGSRRG